jgi:GH18 family chitinase
VEKCAKYFFKAMQVKDIGLPGIVRWNTSDAFENHSMEKIKLFGNNMIERKYICMSNFGGIMLWETCQIFKKNATKRA